MPVKACDQCVYKRHLRNDNYICIHKKLQKKLAEQGIIKMTRGKMLDRCPEKSATLDKSKVGIVEPQQLKKYSALSNIRKSPIADNQSRLF